MRHPIYPVSSIGVIIFWVCTFLAYAEDDPLRIARGTIQQSLPAGWSIVHSETGQIPWGHHWCDDYKGITGTKLVARGIKPVRSSFLSRDDNHWRNVVVGKEALEIWLMPSAYHESRSAWMCHHRPIQPTHVVDLTGLRVYARPSGHSDAEEKRFFDNQLSASNGVKSPESPWNDPKQFSWQTWRIDLKSALVKGFRN